MKFLRKNKHPLTEKEEHALKVLIESCHSNGSGEKARQIIYRLLNEAAIYSDLHNFELHRGFAALYAHFNPNDPCAKIASIKPEGGLNDNKKES